MSDLDESTPVKRRLAIDLPELDMAFEDASPGVYYYLNLETGQLARITDEIQAELEEILEGIDPEPGDVLAAVSAALEESELADWMREEVLEAAAVEADLGTRFVDVPKAESQEGYRDMEEFNETVADERLQVRLARAIEGRGAFRRFKDVLLDSPRERERWFTFRDGRLRARVLEWLEDEGIEPLSPPP